MTIRQLRTTRWMHGLVAALISLPLGTPAAVAYGPVHDLRPPTTQQTTIPFQFTKEALQATFLPEHTLSRQVFEQTGVLVIDRALVQRDPSVPLFLERYLTQVDAR